jgi:hypothetical protein
VWKDKVVASFEALSRHVLGGTEENNDILQSIQVASGLKFEPRTSQIQRGNSNWTATSVARLEACWMHVTSLTAASAKKEASDAFYSNELQTWREIKSTVFFCFRTEATLRKNKLG